MRKNINVLSLSSPYAFNMLIRIFVSMSSTHDTACVRARNGRLDLFYNGDFMMKLKPSMRSFVLIHECLHILLHHCSDYRRSLDPDERLLDNIAMDLAVNSMIPCDGLLIERPRELLDAETKSYGEVIGMFPEMFGFEPMLSYERYRELILEKIGNYGIPALRAMLDANSIDDHSEFTDDPACDALAKAMFENNDRNKMWGNLSVAAQENLRAAQSRQVQWTKYFRYAVGRLAASATMLSRRRWHKMYHKPFLGSETKYINPIGCYLDVSGSMERKDKELFLGEMSRLANICPIFFWSFDAEVEEPKRFRILTKKDFMATHIGVVGGGGTSFQPVIEHAKENGIRNFVILTDGYAPTVTGLPNGYNLLWVITKGGKHDTRNPGTFVQMK